MYRKYIVNGCEETRRYFLSKIGTLTEEDVKKLVNGEQLIRNGNIFRIKNFLGI